MEETGVDIGNTGIRRIVLAGFMGAGKSTVGSLLARKLSWNFLDTDEVIETGAGKTIARIFSDDGEAAFRRAEASVVRTLLLLNHAVLALGGGALETAATRELLRASADTLVVFLDAPLDVLLARCEQQDGNTMRPVLLQREKLQERFSRRLPHFLNAHLRIATKGVTPAEAATRILESLNVKRAREESSHDRAR